MQPHEITLKANLFVVLNSISRLEIQTFFSAVNEPRLICGHAVQVR